MKHHQVNMSRLFKGLDDEETDVIDQASSHVHAILRNVLASGSQGWKLLSVLEKMRETDPGFTFCLQKDNYGCPMGVVWMTPQIQSAFELFGNYISIDAMTRQQNFLLWHYIGPVVLDESKTVAVIAKAIVCSEHNESYQFVLESIFEMAPKCNKTKLCALLQIVLLCPVFSLHWELSKHATSSWIIIIS